MAEIEPLRALRYAPEVVGPLAEVIAPPYDVIDAELRAELVAQSPYNVVEIDLPEDPAGGDRYLHAETLLDHWRTQGALVEEREPAFWALEQRYVAPDGTAQRRRGVFARVRVTDYGPGRIRPHERTHPGPKEDRLRLTRATRANLSPIFTLFPDPDGAAQAVIDRAAAGVPAAEADDHEGTANALWRIDDPAAIAALQAALADAELLIADGHHRYETARAYAEEIGGEGPHRYVLMLLCSLSDPGLLVFPTHRLLTGLAADRSKQEAIRDTLARDFEIEAVDRDRLEPRGDAAGRTQLGYMDSFHRQPYLLTLKDQAIADAALPGKPDPYRRLDTAVLEALILKGALGMTEDDISQLAGLAYSKSFDDAVDAVETGRADACFFMRATPVDQVRAVAETGESMPPKSTFFHPKIPTGLLFNLLQ
ncbi:MAG: DUF1015 domain-containing protein [Solirubrobacterales bacterium]|nr:DUF1015 domain-containing protein [Solirubrobacterales bacterium]